MGKHTKLCGIAETEHGACRMSSVQGNGCSSFASLRRASVADRISGMHCTASQSVQKSFSAPSDVFQTDWQKNMCRCFDVALSS